jgi:hypothetical protein
VSSTVVFNVSLLRIGTAFDDVQNFYNF